MTVAEFGARLRGRSVNIGATCGEYFAEVEGSPDTLWSATWEHLQELICEEAERLEAEAA